MFKLISKESRSQQSIPVKDILLKDVQGEVILIRSAQETTICSRNADDLIKKAPEWFFSIVYSESIVAGNVSQKGGRFEPVRKDQAIDRIGKWVFEKMKLCPLQ